MAVFVIGLGGVVGELWVQDGLFLVLVLVLCGVFGYRLYQKNNGECNFKEVIEVDDKAIVLVICFGYLFFNVYKSLGSVLKILIEEIFKKWQRVKYEV